jgi:transposase
MHDLRIRALIERQIRELGARIADERRRLEQAVRRHQDLGRRLDLLQSIPGIGRVIALCLVVRMPELGGLGRGAVASLAGLAPFVHQSGKYQGQTHIGGGRAAVRKALYMAAMSASRHHPELRLMYQRLVAAAKARIAALLACARKLLVQAEAVVAHDAPWQDRRPRQA